MIKNKQWTGGIDEEYETQHFGFGSQCLKIAVRQMVEQKIINGVKDMESLLLDSLLLNETDKAILTKSCDKLVRLYCERAGPSFDVVDNEIERILTVPSNVVLPGDEYQLDQFTDSEYEKLKEEVADLRKRVERGALMEALLKAEEEELSTVDKVCETAKKDMDVLDLLSKNSETNSKSVLSETMFLSASVNLKQKSDFDFY
ncbi:putative LSM16-like protein [Operophtera brumata]|uniref:Protein MIS12 homolog n=1 Tax=Operophtera brumata TaxID=104452 RepID=A0A0L7LDQ6_OPEBR|nr:putative LSM16-like protein [Operophtera brumata]